MRYFLYARKSTDVEDKQVLSIESQLAELRALAKHEQLNVVEVFVEKKSAKMPGRPVFEEMLKRIEKGEAQGIVCWKIDRLSRNPVDSGRISWLLQQGGIAKIVTHDRAYLPHDNVLLMSVEFGMANQYIRDLSVNVTRGLHQKARMGIYPSSAPIGYLNDPRTKTIVIDRRKAPLVRKAFELYAKNESRLEDVANFLFQNGIKTGATRGWSKGGGKPLKRGQVSFLLSNPFYYGHFKYSGEMYEGKHTPIVNKVLFDAVQKVLALRGRAHNKAINEPQAYYGLLRCGECGMSITAEDKLKRQKNGNTHQYVYYRCTKKGTSRCAQPYVREEALDFQLSELLARFVLPPEWAGELNRLMDKDEKDTSQIAAATVQEMRSKIAVLDGKIARLTDLFVEQDIERTDYLTRRNALMSEKRSLQEQSLLLERDAAAWLEPMREWINEAQALNGIVQSQNYPSKKSSLQKVFGSNLTLHAREARGAPQNQWLYLAQAKTDFPKMGFVSTMVTPRGIEPRFTP